MYVFTAGNRHKQNSRFCKEIREYNFRFWWRRVHEDASQGMYMSKIEICFFTARILLFSVHFQEMPGFKGKRKRGLTLTLYKKPYRYRLPVSPPSKRTKTSSSTPNLKSPSIRTPSLLKKSFNFKIFISFQTDFHIYSARYDNVTLSPLVLQ